MPRRVLQSGALKRRIAKEKQDKLNSVLAKTPRLSQFFTINASVSADVLVTPTSYPSASVNATVNSEVSQAHDLNAESDLEHFEDNTVVVHHCPLTASSTNENDDIFLGQKEPISDSSHSVHDEYECRSTDPAEWFPIRSATVDFWIEKGPDSCQNKTDSDSYMKSKRYYNPTQRQPKGHFRFMKNHMFYTRRTNGEMHLRKWMLYSPSKGSVYCFFCTLMTSQKDQFSQVDGFNDWKKADERIRTHEESDVHRDCILSICNRRKEYCHVDRSLEKQCQERKQYWRDVLCRVVAVVTHLAERGLPFRGDDEIIGSKHNGNFLGCIELIAKFDPFLATHIENFGNAGRGKPAYLSSTIFEEFIQIMANHVRGTIVREIAMAKYFSVSVDSTPDLTHVDQLTVIARYVLNGVPVERFLTFLQISSHMAEDLANTLLDYLKTEAIDFMDCRGQSYDNANNMAGRYSGMQARLRQVNPLAIFVPCAAHSLNLVGSNSVDCCVEAVSFFGFLQKVYTFFSASTHRWSVLMKHLKEKGGGLTLKSLSDTRWSAGADATKALFDSYANIKAALEEMADDEHQNGTSRHEADSLSQTMELVETAFLCDLWNTILVRFSATSKSLQHSKIDLKSAVELLTSLKTFVNTLRDSFDTFEMRAQELSGSSTYRTDQSRKRKRNMQYDDVQSEGVVLTGREKFRTETYLVIIDCLIMALNYRISAYQSVYDRFKVIVDSDVLTDEAIHLEAQKLAQEYPSDLSVEVFPGEMSQFISFAKARGCDSPLSRASLLHTEELQETFPNVSVALRMYLSLMVTNCSGERSFSKMALIKNKLRSTMRDDRLSALTLLSIESDLLRQISFDDIIDTFATAKSRKCHVLVA